MRDARERLVLEALERGGVIRVHRGVPHTTARFQGAMVRAAQTLYELGDESGDLSVPIALALLDLGGAQLSEQQVAEMVNVLMPIEVSELSPKPGRHPGTRASFGHRRED